MKRSNKSLRLKELQKPCFQAVYGDDTKNKYSIVSDLRGKLEAVGIETRGEETKGNMEILVEKKNVGRALKLLCKELSCPCQTRYHAVIYYKNRWIGKRWMKWRTFGTYHSQGLALQRARLELKDMKQTDPDSYRTLQFRIKAEEDDPRRDEDSDNEFSENLA